MTIRLVNRRKPTHSVCRYLYAFTFERAEVIGDGSDNILTVCSTRAGRTQYVF